ncbi:hypothetical protein [Saccharothrix sp. Mg75]|uniref:hypothetical protein n=1 Tax=Saccharothrix sp. Mg75 TaxID=3445357 RepID=UPI003EECDFCC
MADVDVEVRTPPGVRVVAAVAVVLLAHSYLFGLWASRDGQSPWLLLLVRTWVNQPTGVGEDFGFLATALLLLAAGYAAGGPGHRVARLLRRAVPVVACAALAAALLDLLGAHPLVETPVTAPVAAVALFGLLAAALRPLTRTPWLRAPWLRVAVLLELACAVVLLVGWAVDAGGPGFLRPVGPVAALVPLLVVGQLARLVRDGLVTVPQGAGLGLAALAVLVVADRTTPDAAGYWHPLGAVLAVLLFLIALPRGGAWADARPVRWLSDRALPLYASVPVVGYAAVDLLGALPLVLAVPLGAGVAGLAAEGLHRLSGRVS